MTICIGLKLSDCVILGADSRITTFPEGAISDDCQKVVPVADTLWAALQGNYQFTSALVTCLKENFVDGSLLERLNLLQPVASALYQREKSHLAHQAPTYNFLAGLIVGGYDRASGAFQLYTLTSDDSFVPVEREGAIIGGEDEDKTVARTIVRDVPDDFLPIQQRIRTAIVAVSQRNPKIGPHGHIVTIRAGTSEVEPF